MLKTVGWAIAGVWLCAGAAVAATPALYAAKQAADGATVYTQDCAMCHGVDLKGGAGPALIGQGFAAPGSDSTIGGVFSVLAQQMPATAPGSLTHAQDEDAMAYILQQNGYPAGAKPLDFEDSINSSAPLVSQVK